MSYIPNVPHNSTFYICNLYTLLRPMLLPLDKFRFKVNYALIVEKCYLTSPLLFKKNVVSTAKGPVRR